MTAQYKHWILSQDEEKISHLCFSHQEATNTINEEVLDELDAVLDEITQDKKAKGVILFSGKDKGFIAGADIKHIKALKDVGDVVAFLKKGQRVFAKLEALAIPTVAMIDGFCLGGGLELSLACSYRVAENGDETRLGLPEVKLGIRPGWGGTVRLTQLIGPVAAMDLILSGRLVRSSAAAKMGFVDAAVPKRQLLRAARHFILKQPPKHQASFLQKLMNKQPVRAILAKVLYAKLEKKISRKHYPAPFMVVDNWLRDAATGIKAYENEVTSVVKLATETDTSKNLIRVFFLQERLKAFAKETDAQVKHVHVIGAGTMGGDIAAWCALQGLRVTLEDREAKYIAPAMQRAHKFFKKKLKKRHLIQAAMDRLIPDVKGRGVAKADLIIEAIFEDLTVKQALFKKLEQQAKSDAILATNTSSIPLDEINTELKDPSRLVGIHFFNPVAMMPLVEIVSGEKTSPEVQAKATAFIGKIKRLPLPVQSSPGFLVNRVLMPYLLECMKLLQEGLPGELIDDVATDFGMPMGPVELADTIGLDVCLSVAKNLAQHFSVDIPEELNKMVAAGDLGKKTGKGFYLYKKGKALKKKVPYAANRAEISQRLIQAMLDEAACCLREKVVADADLLDAGMIFGTGFAPFRGGPMHYLESLKDNSDEIIADKPPETVET